MESIKRVFLSVLYGGSLVRVSNSNQFLVVEVALCSIVVVRGVVQVIQNWFYRNSNPSRKFEVISRLPGFYRMNEDGVYPTSVPFCPFWGNSVSRGQFKIQFLVVEMALCSIEVVRGVVQVVQNWFTGIRIRPESSRLG